MGARIMPGKMITFGKKVLDEWNADKVTRLAASLAYYTVFSLAPLLIVIIAVVGLVLGTDVAQKQIVGQFQALVGAQGADLVNGLLNNTRRVQTNIIAAVIGIVAILLGATGVVGELKDALNTIWNVAPKPGRNFFATIIERLFSFGMVLGIGFLLLVSLMVSAALTAFGSYVSGFFSQWVLIAQVLDLLISFLGVTFLFAVLFKFLPDAHVAWRDVWFGSVVTALLFTLGKYLIGLYLGNSNVATPFGAAGSLVILFIWVYYMAQILFLGAEITQVYANQYGRGIQPNSQSIALSHAARVEQGTRAPTAPNRGTSPANQPAGSEVSAGAAAVPSKPNEAKAPKSQYGGKGYLFGAVAAGALIVLGKFLSERESTAPRVRPSQHP